MNAPQIIVICLWVFSLTFFAVKHGKLRLSPRYNFWEALIGVGIYASLLWWGGFFS